MRIHVAFVAIVGHLAASPDAHFAISQSANEHCPFCPHHKRIQNKDGLNNGSVCILWERTLWSKSSHQGDNGEEMNIFSVASGDQRDRPKSRETPKTPYNFNLSNWLGQMQLDFARIFALYQNVDLLPLSVFQCFFPTLPSLLCPALAHLMFCWFVWSWLVSCAHLTAFQTWCSWSGHFILCWKITPFACAGGYDLFCSVARGAFIKSSHFCIHLMKRTHVNPDFMIWYAGTQKK